MTALLDTPLSSWHRQHGGRMIAFAGWWMPLQYRSIIEEHRATRGAVGLFDTSHLGRFYFADPRALDILDRLTTRRVADLPLGRIRYALLTDQRGGVLDDVLVYHLRSERGPFALMVVNASNRSKIWDWLQRQAPQLGRFGAEDRTLTTAMIAVQGPKALDTLALLCGSDPRRLGRYAGVVTRVAETEAILSRTGYTGEDGCELIVPAAAALPLWQELVALAELRGGQPVGLGARDTLRLEAALPLYSHELSEAINAAQTGLEFAIDLEEHEFIGREAIAEAFQDPCLPRRVGIRLEGQRAARQHDRVLVGGYGVGEVTSGAYSPTLAVPIAMGYVKPQAAQMGTQVQVEVRGHKLSGCIVALPFYRRPKASR